MTWPHTTATLLGIWIFTGAGIETLAWHERQLSAQARRHAVTERNYAKAEQFVDGCIQGRVIALDDLAYDCSNVRLLNLPARLLHDEIAATTIPHG